MSAQYATYDFSGRVVLITGASGGLGPALVAAFIAAGATVVGVGSDAGKNHEASIRAMLPPDGGDRFTLVATNALDEASVTKVVEGIVAEHSRLDVLVNAIGGFYAGDPVTATPLDAWQRMLTLNLQPTFLFAKHAAQAMSSHRWGRIINVSSRAAHSGRKNAAAYATAKNGVITLTEAQAEELRDSGVTVNAIVPSIIATPNNRAAMPKADTSRWPTPGQIARVVLFLASDDAELVSGAAIPVYGRA
jgi:NAD(P)-dependent dehydrogenase (short-subunit alcohol dehydrogenase family)